MGLFLAVAVEAPSRAMQRSGNRVDATGDLHPAIVNSGAWRSRAAPAHPS